MKLTNTFKQWLINNNYRPTIGTPRCEYSGLPDYHTKEGKLYNTIKLAIRWNEHNQ